MTEEVDRILAEQRRAAAYLAEFPDGPEVRGARLGASDWVMEEVLTMDKPLDDYHHFLERKRQYGADSGFKPVFMPAFLFDFQSFLVDWCVRKGRSALFADCGLGKTPMELVVAENIVRHTNKPVLLATPLAVGPQTIAEGEKFGIECVRSQDGTFPSGARIIVTNYERIHHFDPDKFAGFVGDESSILKNFNGKRKGQITEFMRRIPYRLLSTATPAPNNYVELGTHSEALGELGYMDMLSRFFKNDQNTCDTKGRYHGYSAPRQFETPGWRFKGHAEQHFYRWVCSWARAGRKPSDFGQFDDDRFNLAPFELKEHIVQTKTLADGMLFALPASNFQEEREERRRTIQERCEKAAELVADTGKPAIIWCHLNDEGDLLERIIPECRQIKGATSDEAREEIYTAFSNGQLRVLPIKARIGAWGMNWQHCDHVVSFASHSYEGFYQGVRRCWRFGQKNKVTVDLIATEGEAGARENMLGKSAAADRMFTRLTEHMHEALAVSRDQEYNERPIIPSWL